MSPNIDTHENTSVSTNRKTCLKMIARILDNDIIVSIATVRVTIVHETANTKAALQAILVQILTIA